MVFVSPWRAYELRNYVVAISLIVLILLLKATLVTGQLNDRSTAVLDSRCKGRGYLNETDGSCSCISPFYGRDCNFQYCPHGTSWSSKPIEAHTKYQPYTECSDMGDCNKFTGKCICRDGYEGRAKEVIAHKITLRQEV